jgi:nitrite reductase/ring-hydroxylating ferredoxin subunit
MDERRHPPDDAPPAPQVARREFLARAGVTLAAGCGLALAAGSVRLMQADFQEGAPARFALGPAAEFKLRTLTWLRERDLFVLHDDEGFGAFSARCTHLGCTVQRTADGFLCPCHGARFDPAGRPVSGPARTPLPWFRVWLSPDGRLWVDTRETVEPGARPLSGPVASAGRGEPA